VMGVSLVRGNPQAEGAEQVAGDGNQCQQQARYPRVGRNPRIMPCRLRPEEASFYL
jgi:hypothetical protein